MPVLEWHAVPPHPLSDLPVLPALLANASCGTARTSNSSSTSATCLEPFSPILITPLAVPSLFHSKRFVGLVRQVPIMAKSESVGIMTIPTPRAFMHHN